RSGATIAVGLATGLTRPASARFSFLLSTPIILGAIGKQGVDLVHRGVPASDVVPIVLGIVAAAISGYLCINFLLNYLRRRSLLVFVVYRVLVGLVVIAMAVTGQLSAGG